MKKQAQEYEKLQLVLNDCGKARDTYRQQLYQEKTARRRQFLAASDTRVWQIACGFLAVTCILIGITN